MSRRLLGRGLVQAILGATVLIFALTIGMPAGTAHAGPALDLQEQFLQAFNNEDQALIRSLVTDDFAVQNNADCVTPCDGLSELGVLMAIHLQIDVLSVQETGDILNGRIIGTSNNFNLIAPGVTRFLAATRMVTRNGKVALLDIQLDLSDPQSAALADQFRAARGPQSGVLGLQTQFVDALNRGDLAAIRNLITDDFVVRGNVGCQTPCQGDAFMQVFVTIHLRISVLSTKVDGTTVTSRVSAESPRFDLIVPGINRVLANVTVTTRGGKAASLEIQLDTSDTLSAALANDLKQTQVTAPPPAAPQAAPAPSSPALPSTGDGGLLARDGTGRGHWVVLVGLALVGLSSLTFSHVFARSRR